MSLLLPHPEKTVQKIVEFLRAQYKNAQAERAVIAVSGGIDSAVSLTLLCKAFPQTYILPVLLPYGRQNMDDAKTMLVWNNIPHQQWIDRSITKMVDTTTKELRIANTETMRKGNVMARTRMIVIYDLAKKHHGLVCGTENKSEHYLGYFTRFGDAASDIEPIQHLYKTQVRQLAEFLNIPHQIIAKPPSAGLWDKQTDELELGFSYADADLVLEQYIDKKQKPSQMHIDTISDELVARIIARVDAQCFKHDVPYIL